MLDDEIIDAIRERQSARARLARSISAPLPGDGAIPPTPATPRSLPVLQPAVAPGAVQFSDDRFRCGKLACELAASTCVERQQQAHQRRRHGSRLSSYELNQHATASHMATCRHCPDGRQIAARLGVQIVESSGKGYLDDERFREAPVRKPRRREAGGRP